MNKSSEERTSEATSTPRQEDEEDEDDDTTSRKNFRDLIAQYDLECEEDELEDLDELDISEKELTTLPPLLFDIEFPALTSLCLEKNNLTCLPDDIANFTNLEQFYLRENQLQRLPETIGALQTLDSLYCEDNQLSEAGIPSSFGELVNLKGLCLHRNMFTVGPGGGFYHRPTSFA